ncbi:SoxR reducing system RseC family protein [Shewanella dokdonensis]|uniref:SoxR reducing system RseC family protein n=1 Tax=Shewanella dokdonensis TaxID=712036 RepID=A0ABX8DFP8_9GAMM|nr:SoxR reducing system RseC family protein [Shewanella dokdonensis]MCL1073645.1 SoxR reducing system RseC family protein [Shewanella dokdonensis]QVK22612.1 SoxR reducing system RseC family protein [Shewanella dokdonensis]
MMEQVAKVIGADTDGWVTVQVEMKSACSHCSQGESCGTSAVAKAFSSKFQQFSLPATETYPKGTLLRLGLPESVVLKAAALVYLLPLIGMFVGGTLGNILAGVLNVNSDATSLLLAVLVALCAWFLGKRQARLLEASAQPVILANLGRSLTTEDVDSNGCCHP